MPNLQTTDKCDGCGKLLGIKCDRNARGFARALLAGLYVKEHNTLTTREYKFYCSQGCANSESI